MDTPIIPMRLTLKGEVRPLATVQAVVSIGHPMESGYRLQDNGTRIAKHAIETITLSLDGQRVFTLRAGIGLSAHPYLAFSLTLPSTLPTVLRIEWRDNLGQSGQLERSLASP